MNRRDLLLGGAIACAAIPLARPGRADAARLPISTVTVNVLSVVLVSQDTEVPRGPGTGAVFERSNFVAKARIVEIPHNEHKLTPGAIIDIRYRTDVRKPPDSNFRGNTKMLVEGQTVTVELFGNGSSFEWRP